MVVRCEEVWREVSNYLDGEVDSTLRAAIEDHVLGCQRCTAVLDGTRNVVQLYGDDRLMEVPFGFSQRLHRRLDENMPASMPRRGFLGWMVAAAAACLVFGTLEAARSSALRGQQLRSELAKPGRGVPPDMIVVVSEQGRLFHAPGCDYIREKTELRTLTAADASRKGYAPCVRCMGKYLARNRDDLKTDIVIIAKAQER